MTDEAKALVEELRLWRLQSTDEIADLIETQAREIERLKREKAVVSDLWEQQKEIALGYLADCNKAADLIETQAREIERLGVIAGGNASLVCKVLDEKDAEIARLREELAEAYIKLSGKSIHTSDCATSYAPAMEPGPCNCDAPGDSHD